MLKFDKICRSVYYLRMNKGQLTRQRMIDTASTLFEQQGYAATGINQILAESNTPRGSFYFHFKEGKEELGLAVIKNHQAKFAAMLHEILGQSPTAQAGVENVIDALAMQMESSQCQTGCPITSIATEMAGVSTPLRRSAETAYEDWSALITPHLISDGYSANDAYSIARAAICAIEGALIMCRVYQSRGPLDDVKFQLTKLFI